MSRHELINVYNKDEVYFMLNHVTGKRMRIGDQNELVSTASDYIRKDIPYWLPNEPWSEHKFQRMLMGVDYDTFQNIFKQQNLTGKDAEQKFESKTKEIVDEDGEIRQSYFTIVTKKLKPYTFYTGSGAILDIRCFIPEIKAYLLAGEFKTRCVQNMRTWRNRHHHHTFGYKRKFHKRELQAKISCEEMGVKYRTKSLPYKGDVWFEYYENATRRSSGWKDKKNKKQWMHNIKNRKKECSSPRTYWKEMVSKMTIEIEDDILNDILFD